MLEVKSFQDVLDFLYSRKGTYGITYKLDRVILLFEKLGIRDVPFKVIHITGTNGKGSTSAMLESIYRNAKNKTGLFTSPHLISVRERIRVNHQKIPEEDFVRLFQKVFPIAEALECENKEFRISFFEYITAIALLFFKEQEIDIAIMEVGLGGRLDATNAVRNTTISVITTIAHDHENVLGATLPAIAKEKSGIIRKNSLCVLGKNISGEVFETIIHTAREKNCTLFQVEQLSFVFPEADYQNYNAATARLTAQVLTKHNILPLTESQIEYGIKHFFWPGRWQKVQLGDTLLIFDGAHNEEGAQALAKEIKNLHRDVTLIFGSNTVDRATKMLAILAPLCKEIFFTKSRHESALDVILLKKCLPSASYCKIENIELEKISTFIHNRGGEVVLVAGSLYLVGDIIKELEMSHEID